MTNPTEAAPRWIPAASKPGGLVWPDLVRRLGGEIDVYVRMVNDVAVETVNRRGVRCTVNIADLLVRIDPPAQLPESTDAFRRRLAEANSLLCEVHTMLGIVEPNSPLCDTIGAYLDAMSLDDANDVRRLALTNIPTPTEAADGE